MAKISISYLSKYGNGRRAMEHLADLLREKDQDVELFPMDKTNPNDLPASDIYVFSTSVHIGKPPRRARGYAKKFNRDGKYVLVITHASNLDGSKYSPTRTNEIMNESLSFPGLSPVRDTLFIKVKDLKGPLEDNWEQKISELADSLSS
jgi:flavodoxin